MKKLFNLIKTQDHESQFAHTGLRFFTYITLILILPDAQRFIEYIDINRIPHCGYFVSYGLPFKLTITTVHFFYWALMVAAFFSAIGFLFRISAFVTFISFSVLILHTLSSCFSNHQYYPLGLILLFWLINGTTGSQYIFRFLKIYFCLAFLFAGMSKLLKSGMSWITTDSLFNMISLQNFLHQGFAKQIDYYWLNQMILNQPVLTNILALLTILIEIGAPIAIAVNRYKWICIALIGMMQLGIQLIMYIEFEPWIIIYYVWVFSAVDFLLKDKFETLSIKNFFLRK